MLQHRRVHWRAVGLQEKRAVGENWTSTQGGPLFSDSPCMLISYTCTMLVLALGVHLWAKLLHIREHIQVKWLDAAWGLRCSAISLRSLQTVCRRRHSVGLGKGGSVRGWVWHPLAHLVQNGFGSRSCSLEAQVAAWKLRLHSGSSHCRILDRGVGLAPPRPFNSKWVWELKLQPGGSGCSLEAQIALWKLRLQPGG